MTIFVNGERICNKNLPATAAPCVTIPNNMIPLIADIATCCSTMCITTNRRVFFKLRFRGTKGDTTNIVMVDTWGPEMSIAANYQVSQ